MSYSARAVSLIHPSAWKVSVLGTSPVRRSEKFALRVGLLLDHRLCWLSCGYGVRVPMHYLPLAVFGSIDHRNSQVDRGNVLPCAYLGLLSLYPTV
jgi:hypothetical protein